MSVSAYRVSEKVCAEQIGRGKIRIDSDGASFVDLKNSELFFALPPTVLPLMSEVAMPELTFEPNLLLSTS